MKDRIQNIVNKVRDLRVNTDVVAPPETCFDGEVGGHDVVIFRECIDTKVFDSPDVVDRLAKVRAELLDAEVGGNFYSNGEKI